MIISRGRRYIFVHIPKTGGTALSLALEARAMADDILIGDTPKAVKRRGQVKKLAAAGRLWKHSMLADIEGVVARSDLDSLFTLTLVRNPWDRTVSYYHWLRAQTWDHAAVRLAKAVDFTTFLNDPATLSALSVPYGAYMRDGAGVERATLFARIEALDTDLAPFWSHVGLDLSPVGRANASDRARDFRPYYSDADAETLGRVAAEDIARFGYSFESFAPQM